MEIGAMTLGKWRSGFTMHWKGLTMEILKIYVIQLINIMSHIHAFMPITMTNLVKSDDQEQTNA